METWRNELYHHGILGQKWGVRRYQNEDGTYTNAGKERRRSENNVRTFNKDLDERTLLRGKTRRGEVVSVYQDRHSKIQRLMAKGFKSINKNMLNSKIMTISVADEKVGELQLFKESPTSINGTWLGIESQHRGKGYATAALTSAIDYCREQGYKQFTLEVPGNSPDARHIYEKMGFKVTHEVSSPDDDFVWGGLTGMVLEL